VFVYQHDNQGTNKHRMMKLGVGVVYTNLGRVISWGYRPLGAHPKMWYSGTTLAKISAGCLVLCRAELHLYFRALWIWWLVVRPADYGAHPPRWTIGQLCCHQRAISQSAR